MSAVAVIMHHPEYGCHIDIGTWEDIKGENYAGKENHFTGVIFMPLDSWDDRDVLQCLMANTHVGQDVGIHIKEPSAPQRPEDLDNGLIGFIARMLNANGRVVYFSAE